jgi:hypothetical protein
MLVLARGNRLVTGLQRPQRNADCDEAMRLARGVSDLTSRARVQACAAMYRADAKLP